MVARSKGGKEIVLVYLFGINQNVMLLQETTGPIIDAAIKIHRILGPGLFESVYEEVMDYELRKQGLVVERQVAIPVRYEAIKMEVGFRPDLIVNKEVIIEIKSVEAIKPVFKKQVITYLRLTGYKIGLLINFNEELLKDGITRLFNNEVKSSPLLLCSVRKNIGAASAKKLPGKVPK